MCEAFSILCFRSRGHPSRFRGTYAAMIITRKMLLSSHTFKLLVENIMLAMLRKIEADMANSWAVTVQYCTLCMVTGSPKHYMMVFSTGGEMNKCTSFTCKVSRVKTALTIARE